MLTAAAWTAGAVRLAALALFEATLAQLVRFSGGSLRMPGALARGPALAGDMFAQPWKRSREALALDRCIFGYVARGGLQPLLLVARGVLPFGPQRSEHLRFVGREGPTA